MPEKLKFVRLKSVFRRKNLPVLFSPAGNVFFVSVKFTILGSGSSGNCAYIETDEARILVDAGFSPRQIRTRLASIGRTPENLTAILITHEHSGPHRRTSWHRR